MPIASSLMPTSEPRARLDRDRQAAPQLFERLREAIISLELTPGTTLSRTEIAAQFGVSQTPVRDALMRLDEEGLVEVFPQHATVVSPIDLRSAQQAHVLRRSLELEIVRSLALDPPPALVAALDGLIAQQALAAGAGDFETLTTLDRLFHQRLYEAAGLHELWLLVRSRSGHIDRLRRLHLPTPGKAQDILRHHRLILASIAGGRPDEAQRHLRDHLSGTLAHVAEIRARYPAYIRD
ncbi:GntR family transcriptional regulator [Labrys wisconsinensis]|uniref:DNA-binding GntR family transcriptional regulator n=1 Tax=Labrys wisconsinensis TaxID=425677 RepID=A0ABU0J8E1_9HYPH|nr:GntR family transcriptional regulator [Labrys wisconsinensis]MDQ0470547.1 DNA-binding GntR family transcriptional regulator [Labrys wisconsinensis]